MRRSALSTVFAGGALVAALTLASSAPASAAGRESPEPQVRTFAGWLGAVWNRAVEAVSLTIDPDGSTVNGAGEPPPQPAGDVSWTIDPDG
jgi:hypothetical protein